MARLLPEVCNIQYGFPFDSSKFSASEGMPIIRIRDVLRGYSETFTTQEFDESYIVNDGDILIGMDGEFNIAKWGKEPALLNQRVCRLFPKDNIDPDYLFYFLQGVLKKIEDRTAFATVKHLSAKELNKISVPFPKIEEQKRIGEIINKTNELISCRKEQLSKLDELVKARFVEMFGEVADWHKYDGVALGTICTTLSGGTPTTRVPEYYEGNIPWISTPYLGSNHIDGSNAKAYITEDAIENSATHLIPANTIMFGIRVGVGKSSIIDEPMCANQDIVALMDIDTDKYNLLFVKYVLDSYQSYFDSIKKGATILGITTEDLKKVFIPTVGINVQNEFAAFVEQTEKTKAEVQKSLDELEILKKALMQKYFG